MHSILLAPHNDDETLFASYVCQQERPLVVVCLRSFVQERVGIRWITREAETREAMHIFRCDWEQWEYRDDRPDWSRIARDLRHLRDSQEPDLVYAPYPDFERNGWPDDGSVTGFGLYHHDMIGKLAAKIFDHVVHYHTYSRWHGRTEEGEEVFPTPQQIVNKLTALSKYQSQIEERSTQHHFVGSQREWLAV